ncbi:MAG: hypothetical protein NVS3B10_31760 [Polyangiales bacterium]
MGVATGAHDAMLAQQCLTAAGESGLPAFGKHDFMALALVPFTDVAAKQEGDLAPLPNDGLATVTSAKWGTFKGCIPADHMEQLGQHSLPDVNVRTGFDVARFYADVAGDLAEQGL